MSVGFYVSMEVMEMRITKNELGKVVTLLLDKVHKTNSDTAAVVALHGDLGAGKTTFTQEFARTLGVKENVISPTFVIMKSYEITDPVFKHLIHIDAYRLEKSEELLKLGLQKLLEDKTNLIIIEWPELVPDCIPENACHLTLTHEDEETRTVKF